MRHRWQKWDGEIPEINHDQLVNQAFHYLTMIVGCKVAFKERKASTREEPDAIGFKGTFSTLIECKASRADFHADKKKFFRAKPERGMGYERFFMAPVGLLLPSEMPDGWGLLEVHEKGRAGYRKVEIACDSKGFCERNQNEEVSYLVSAIRRINISMAVFVERTSDTEQETMEQ